MAYTETKTTSYGQRISGSLKGIGIGFLLFIAGTCLLFWNEGNYVKTRKAIQESEGVAVHTDNVETINPSLNGKLIHASALADTKEVLTDDLFGVSDTAIALTRKVEYYQWKEKTKTETRDKIGGEQEEITTYYYDSEWVSAPINSSQFKDVSYRNENFVITSIESKDWLAKDVSFGAYRLPTFIISSISGQTPADIQLTPEKKQAWEKKIAENMEALGRRPKASSTLSAADSESEAVNTVVRDAAGNRYDFLHIEGNMAYIGQSPTTPRVGDIRVTMSVIFPAEISILAQVNGNTFEQYTAQNGKEFSRVEMGAVSMANMFAHAHSSNSAMTWLLRLAGLLFVMFGLRAMFSILPILFKVLPFLSDIVGTGVGVVTFVFGFVWSLLIIAISWLFYRPLIGIGLLVVIIASIIYLKKRAIKQNVAIS